MTFRIRKSGYHAHYGKGCYFPEFSEVFMGWGGWGSMELPYHLRSNGVGFSTIEEARAFIEEFKEQREKNIAWAKKMEDTFIKL